MFEIFWSPSLKTDSTLALASFTERSCDHHQVNASDDSTADMRLGTFYPVIKGWPLGRPIGHPSYIYIPYIPASKVGQPSHITYTLSSAVVHPDYILSSAQPIWIQIRSCRFKHCAEYFMCKTERSVHYHVREPNFIGILLRQMIWPQGITISLKGIMTV